MQPKATNRSTAPTPEALAIAVADQTASVREAFEAGVKAGTVELVLTDAQATALNDVINNAILEGFERYFAKL